MSAIQGTAVLSGCPALQVGQNFHVEVVNGVEVPVAYQLKLYDSLGN